ncbi:hypothetical protein SARC_02896 [Sphaeroforma arctica JP610]|uniref:Uncharacterized protein n=1 Tax=Sphaeroforma arctica JP610 TaxID=667725 RepID=A0A0L0G7M7_9EUKA|nr:hypothetical protein SARC_02896 [Sphaeroforma arctica JP610]KNC84886.1 hypothetical protein SARC_02896 [Sphaeroforma arctica JP610]|eukprot:XP_014158788.1 hypothetical protein SARC_02896 [Sphaeroforma arctica JP610]
MIQELLTTKMSDQTKATLFGDMMTTGSLRCDPWRECEEADVSYYVTPTRGTSRKQEKWSIYKHMSNAPGVCFNNIDTFALHGNPVFPVVYEQPPTCVRHS